MTVGEGREEREREREGERRREKEGEREREGEKRRERGKEREGGVLTWVKQAPSVWQSLSSQSLQRHSRPPATATQTYSDNHNNFNTIHISIHMYINSHFCYSTDVYNICFKLRTLEQPKVMI